MEAEEEKEDYGEEISQGIFIAGLGLYVEADNTLVIADIHLGYEEAMNKQGVMVPRFNYKETKKRLAKIIMELPKLDSIIINGDLKHEFGRISDQEWDEVLGLLEFLQKFCKNLVLLQGNHDTILGPIANWRNLRVVGKGLMLGKAEVYVTHGHEVFETSGYRSAARVIIGHDHPAVSIREGPKTETYKCFLKGKYGEKELIVMPSFNAVTTGADVQKEKLLSPFLQQPLDEFEVWAIEDKPYHFKRLGDLENN